MKNLLNKLASMPKLLGISIVLLYALTFAEFSSILTRMDFETMLSETDAIQEILPTFIKLNYSLSILSSIAIWIVLCLLFHLVALLFDGGRKFSEFLNASAYIYIIPAIAIFVSILLLKRIDTSNVVDIEEFVNSSKDIKLISTIVNYSFFPFYVLAGLIIHYLYDIKWIKSFLCVAIPVIGIWGTSTLVKFMYS